MVLIIKVITTNNFNNMLNIVEICKLILESETDHSLQMLKTICEEFQEQNPTFSSVRVQYSHMIILDIDSTDEEEVYKFELIPSDAQPTSIVIQQGTIKVSGDQSSVWATTGKCVLDQTNDPLATEHPDLKNYLFAIFSKMV